ncbi:DUF222 domain-containing protein [Citricoccus sp.]|uniref:HNH endonuclease n=1 Tax=Citricoccus sp. TaxID=1978372 RepID=UPI00262E2307|nr:DUF222 domain-containing protein [Citricoccus sp.]HRO31667.1 DUF222 domain-containing protein [Citricoccus sp.]
MFDQNSPKDGTAQTRGPAGESPSGPAGGPASELRGAVVGSPEWAADLAACGVPLGTVVAGPVSPAPVPGSARELVAARMALGLMVPAGTEAEAVDRIRVLEQLKAACAAAQARETAALDTLRRTAEADRGVPVERRGRGLGGELGLARGESPHRGSRQLALARALSEDLTHTLTALSEGSISEERAGVVHRETARLSTSTARRRVDTALVDGLPVLGAQQLAMVARELAVEQDPAAAAEHLDTAVAERRVTVRATDHGMATLTATLPLAQAAACHRALSESAARLAAFGEAEGRTPAQVVADTLVERLTGQVTAAAIPVEVHLVMTDQALLGTEDTPARVPGHGSLPAPVARQIVADTDADVFLRRLYTAPESGQLVAMDSRRRTFPALLRRMVVLRDELCRTPYCNARIKHLDHATAHAAGGQTSWDNASGLCARCNYAKENPGWTHSAGPGQLTVTTPTGHHYRHPTRPLVDAGQSPPPPQHGRFPGFTPLHFSIRQIIALLDAA